METIGHYRIVSELGRGGMGVVYKAHEQSLNRYVALKVLGSHMTEDESNVERFTREAQSAAALNHPNIVQIYAIGEHEDQPYFAMEYVSGTPIQAMIRQRGSIPGPEAAAIMAQTADGLGAAHDIGIIHRDIKPANILLTDKGIVKIADFGLALALGGSSRLTATGWCMGTPGYLSPEQCLDEELDARTDIYSLGVTFYEMLTGSVPFKTDSPLALFRKIVEVEPPPMNELNPSVDDELKAIVAKMMAKKRDERYASCDELKADLGRFLEKVGGSGVSSLAGGVAAAVMASPTPSSPLDVSPTMPVESGKATAPKPPPPPPPVPAVEPPPTVAEPTARAATAEPWDQAVSEPAPVVTEVAPPPPAESSKTAYVVLGLLALAAMAVAALGLGVAWKMGYLGGDRPATADAVEVAQGLTGDPGEDGKAEAAGVDAEASPASALEAVDDSGPSPGASGPESAASAMPTPAVAADSDGTDATTVTSDGNRGSAGATDIDPVERATGHQGGGQPAKSRVGVAEPETRVEPAMPQATGVVVIGTGEPLLDGPAEQTIERALTRIGAEVVDERRLPGLWDLTQKDIVPVSELLRAVRPHARYLVVARAEYLGDREITYMGRRDRVHQSRLHVVCFDLRTGEARGPGYQENIEYTRLNVEKKVGELLRQPLRRVLKGLGQ